MNNNALINSFVWPGLPFCARLTLTVVVRFFLRLIFLIFLRLTAKILSFLRLTAKFLAVLRLTVNPIETLRERGKQMTSALVATAPVISTNRLFSKMAAENLNKSKLKTKTSTRKSTLTLVILPSFSISGEISAEKM